MYLTQPANLIGYVNHNRMHIQLAISKRILCLVSMQCVTKYEDAHMKKYLQVKKAETNLPSNLADGGSFCVFSSQFLMTAKTE